MSRPLRLDHAGAVWHLTARGDEKREVFRTNLDRRNYLRVIDRVVDLFRWRVHAYVLMGNHYHLMVETPEPSLSRGMQHLNSAYAQGFNRRHDRVGHVFQGRFKSILVEKEAHLLELIRYVVLNPVRAGLVREPEHWEWSNYRATAGLTPAPSWLEVNWTLAQFGGGALAGDRYRQFVGAGMADRRTPWVNLKRQVFLGGDQFRREVQARIEAAAVSQEVPRSQRHCIRPTFEAVVRAAAVEFDSSPQLLAQKRRSPLRLAVAFLARHDAGLQVADFASWLGVRQWAASHLASHAENLMARSPMFRKRIDNIRAELRKVTYSQT
jgi:putative transposase